MKMHRDFRRLLGVAALLHNSVISADATPTLVAMQAKPADSVPADMLAQDSIIFGSFTAIFEIGLERNLLGPDKGRHTKTCRYTASDAALALSVETRYESDPPYRMADAPGYRKLDFDPEGNLIVWRSLKKVSLCTADFNRTYDEQETMVIAPNGQIRSKARGATVYEYAVDSRANFYEFDQFCMAAGRGFSGQVEALKAQHTLVNGVRVLVFDAPHGPELRANWFLYTDAQDGSLVRKADRFVPTVDRPTLHMENSGLIRKDGLSLAAQGSLSYAAGDGEHYKLNVTVVDFAARPDQEHLRRIRALVTEPFPPGTEVVDHRDLFLRDRLTDDAPPEK